MIAEPLDKEIILDINQDIIENYQRQFLHETNKNNINQKIKDYLITTKNWDKYTTNSIWSFTNSNILLDYTLPNETDKQNLYSIKNEIIQGFDWAIREGPLCNEQILNTKFKILSSSLSTDNIYKASGQIIPMSRRVCYSSFLTACPRLMEPFLKGEIQ
jgi:U5 small nuclear ribonucleoprotein component